MTDFLTLTAVVGALYLCECCWWIPRGALVFRSFGLETLSPIYPSSGLGNEFAGLVFLNPLPPLGVGFQCERWPISVTEVGILSFVAQTTDPVGRPQQPISFIQFSDVVDASSEGRVLYVASKAFCKVASEPSAARWAGLISDWSRLAPQARSVAIADTLVNAFNFREVSRRVEMFRHECRALRIWCHLLMTFWLVGLPTFVGIHSLRYLLIAWLILMIGTMLVVARQFNISHRELLPERRSLRRRLLLMMALNPISAIRACDSISRHLLMEFHPLAVALALCSRDEAARFARTVLADLHHPLEFTLPADGVQQAAEMEMRRQLSAAAEEAARRAGFDPAALLAPPLPEDSSCKRYCPRCDRQYGGAASTCSACALPLKELLPTNNIAMATTPTDGKATGQGD